MDWFYVCYVYVQLHSALHRKAVISAEALGPEDGYLICPRLVHGLS